jgi:hypothetical protein
LFAFVRNPQQSQGFTPERCTHSFAGVLLNQRIVRGFFPWVWRTLFDRRTQMAGKLHPLEVARQTTPGKYPDGDGLYLIVAGPTSRNWSYRYWINGKERWHGLGSLQDVSLKEARIKRDGARQDVRAGVDIVQANRSAREEAKATAAVSAAPTLSNALNDTSTGIGRSGARSIARNGPPRSKPMPIRRSAR